MDIREGLGGALAVTGLMPEPFGTPWHVCVHGIGLGHAVAPRSDENAAPLLRISQALLERQPEPEHQLQHALLSIAFLCRAAHQDGRNSDSSACAGHITNAIELLANLDDQESHALLLAQLVEVVALTGTLPHFSGRIAPRVAQTLRALLCPGANESERACYKRLAAFTALLHAQRWLVRVYGEEDETAQIDAAADQAFAQLEALGDAFLRRRCQALLITVAARLSGALQRQFEWTERASRLLRECTYTPAPATREPDAIHGGYDYVIFPLALCLSAAAAFEETRRLAHELRAPQRIGELLQLLPAANRASQFVFAAEGLLALEAATPVDLAQRLLACLEDYLEHSSDDDPDAYLRCTYLIYAAARLGMVGRMPDAVFERVARAVGRHGRNTTGYYSLPMTAAYAVFARALGGRRAEALICPEQIALTLAIQPTDLSYPVAETRKLAYALVHAALLRNVRGSGWATAPSLALL